MAKYKANELLTVFPDFDVDEPGFTVELLEEQRKFRLPDVELLSLLDAADDWTDREDLVAHAERDLDLSREEADDLVDQFVEYEFLVAEDDDETLALEDHAAAWRDAGWREALNYHLYIRNLTFLPEMIGETDVQSILQADNEVMQEYAAEEEVPPNYRVYEDAETVPLPEVDRERDVFPFADAVRTTADPDATPDLDRETLSELLFYPFGETSTSNFGEPQGEKVLKAVPSGGARHPVEAYLAVLDVDGVPDGLYHYSVKDHALERLAGGDARRAAETVYDLDDLEFTPSVVVFYGAVLIRSMWRYREPRTYRVIYHDVGHVAETLEMLATAHDRPTRFGIDFDETAATLFGVDRYDEPLLGYSAVA